MKDWIIIAVILVLVISVWDRLRQGISDLTDFGSDLLEPATELVGEASADVVQWWTNDAGLTGASDAFNDVARQKKWFDPYGDITAAGDAAIASGEWGALRASL